MKTRMGCSLALLVVIPVLLVATACIVVVGP